MCIIMRPFYIDEQDGFQQSTNFRLSVISKLIMILAHES